MIINIIGGGPIGCYTGYLLAKKGHSINIYEEDKEIGKPVQCAGIVTKEIEKILSIPSEIIVNKLKKVKVYSKNYKLEVNTEDIVIDREKFDKWISDKAKKAGAKIKLGYKCKFVKGKRIIFENGKEVYSDIIIGADGPLSKVGKSIGITNKCLLGVQARVKGKFDINNYSVYLGSIAPGFFLWIIPESNKIARIGIAGKKAVRKKLNKFISSKKYKIIDYQAGLIPIFENKKVSKKNIYLIGDAAGQVKATTKGGLVPGLKAAKILAKNIEKYEKNLFKLRKELWIHKKIRNILNKFTDKDYNKFVKLTDQKKIKKILKENNRDKPIKLLKKIIIAEPRYLLYSTKIFKKNI